MLGESNQPQLVLSMYQPRLDILVFIYYFFLFFCISFAFFDCDFKYFRFEKITCYVACDKLVYWMLSCDNIRQFYVNRQFFSIDNSLFRSIHIFYEFPFRISIHIFISHINLSICWVIISLLSKMYTFSVTPSSHNTGPERSFLQKWPYTRHPEG